MQYFAISFDSMSFIVVSACSDALSGRFSGSELGGSEFGRVHCQGIMVVSDWLLVPGPEIFEMAEAHS